MKLYQKIFLSIFSVCIVFLTALSIYFLDIFESNLTDQFESKYVSINASIAKTFIELEKTSEKFSLAAINALYLRDKSEGLMDIISLTKFKEEYRLSQVVVANSKGEFVRDTKVDPKTYDLNLFNFCEDYRGMLNRPQMHQITPIILSAAPMIEPIKYTMMSNHDRTRILEVGVHLDFMEEILKGIAETNRDINSISLISPSGNSLGRITKEKGYYLEGEKFNIEGYTKKVTYKGSSLFISSIFLP